jgi:hypothetical protein
LSFRKRKWPQFQKKIAKAPRDSDFRQVPTGGGVCKRKLANSTSDDGRSKRTRKTTKGDGFEQDKGASQRRIQEADTDYVSEDDGSEEFKPDEDGGGSGTGDYFEINGRFNQMRTRENLRKQYDKAIKVDPTLQQLYGDRGSATRSLVVREKVLNMMKSMFVFVVSDHGACRLRESTCT